MITDEKPASGDISNDSRPSIGKYTPDERLLGLSAVARRRLFGRRFPVVSYINRKIGKRWGAFGSARRHRGRPDQVRLQGIRIAIDRARFSDKIIRHLFEGRYERDEGLALRRTLRRDDRVLELGTGIGFMSALAARRLGGENVMTIEANAGLSPIIETTYRLNGVSPRHVVGLMSPKRDAPPRTFYIHKRHLWSSSLAQPDTDFEPTEVPSVSFYETIETFAPSYLVMDIEGGEIELLTDFEAPSVRRMLIEFHPRKTGHAAIDGVFAHLAAAGFGMSRVPGGGNVFYFER